MVRNLILLLLLIGPAWCVESDPSEKPVAEAASKPDTSEPGVPADSEVSPATQDLSVQGVTLEPKAWEKETVRLLPASIRLGAGFDLAYRGGGAVSQGFSIPTYRLTASGETGKAVAYRLSAGQTREFSSAMIPQLLPTEAYVELGATQVLAVRAGMYTPRVNPWWTADLTETKWPDYHEIHRALFASRDIGAELEFLPWEELFQLVLGYTNGSGIFSDNTNNSHAFTGLLKFKVNLGVARLIWGGGGFISGQSTVGSVNYKSSWLTNFFGGLEWLHNKVGIEYVVAHFEDATRLISTLGGAAFVEIGITRWLSLFGRYEQLSISPVTAQKLSQWQVGPTFLIDNNVTLFSTFSNIETAGSNEKVTQLRLRVSL